MSNTRQVALDYAIRLFTCSSHPFPGDFAHVNPRWPLSGGTLNEGWNVRTYTDLFKLANELEAYIKEGSIPEDDDSVPQDNNHDEHDQELEEAIENLR